MKNTVNGWNKKMLNEYAMRIRNITVNTVLGPVTLLQAKRALIAYNYNDIARAKSLGYLGILHDIARIARKK